MPADSESDLLNPVSLLAACGGDAVLLRKMIDSFQSRAPEHIRTMRHAAQAQNIITLRQAAHKLRGLVATFSTSLAAAVGMFEQPDGRSTNNDLHDCDALRDSFQSLSATLSHLSVAELKWRASTFNQA